MAEETLRVRVGGEYALFSRPEFKVERVSYPLITPSAARGLLEAIYWKPEFRWEIRGVFVIRPGVQATLLRNELEDRQGGSPIIIEEKRQQRVSLVLKDVEYVLTAALVLRPHAHDPVAKYADIFRRRLERGQCFHHPCLGTREFAAWFEPAPEIAVPERAFDLDVGQMLFDIAFREDPGRSELEFYVHDVNGARVTRGYTEALFFDAVVRENTLRVPRDRYRQLYRMEGRGA